MAQAFFSRAFQVGEASKIAAMQYVEIAFGYLWDILFLGHPLDVFSIVGSLFIASVVCVIKPTGEGEGEASGEGAEPLDKPGSGLSSDQKAVEMRKLLGSVPDECEDLSSGHEGRGGAKEQA